MERQDSPSASLLQKKNLKVNAELTHTKYGTKLSSIEKSKVETKAYLALKAWSSGSGFFTFRANVIVDYTYEI